MHPPVRPPYFDGSRRAWILSRYPDVADALREPRLWPVAARGEDQTVTRDETGRLRLRGPTLDALPAARAAGWQAQAEQMAHRLLERLPHGHPVDLLAGFALPWCSELALLVVDARPEQHDSLIRLARQVFAATGAPDDSPLRAPAAAATAELERLLAHGPMPMGEPTFVAISQTLPRLLASVWLALYEHPDEVQRLGANPALWPGALEELLRFAGIVRSIWRQARAAVEIGGVEMADGQRLMLMLAAANRDPAQFPEPDRLDLTRRVTAQLALGAGRNSCAGAALIRMAVTVATRTLLERFPAARLNGKPEWRIGSSYGFPESVPVDLRR